MIRRVDRAAQAPVSTRSYRRAPYRFAKRFDYLPFYSVDSGVHPTKPQGGFSVHTWWVQEPTLRAFEQAGIQLDQAIIVDA